MRRRGADRRAAAHAARAGRAGAALLALSLLPGVSAAAAQESPDPPGLRIEYASEGEALREAFPQAAEFLLHLLKPDEAARARLAERLRRRLPAAPLRAYLAYDNDGGFVGYGVVAEEIGKHRPITFLVALAPDLEVREVQVLVYRESRGGEVRHPRFLRQFRGARPDRPLRVGREVVNITGATMSVRAVTAGVRRAQATVAEIYPAGPPDVASARATATRVLRAVEVEQR